MATSGVSADQDRTATPATISGALTASAEGTSLSVARADHAHGTVFTAAGTGAVARSFQNKFGDIFHVKDFGAVCDGVTNDSAAIQATVNAAVSGPNPPLGIVLIPSNCVGTYTNAGGALVFDMRGALLDFGSAYALRTNYVVSRSANPSASGQLRLSNTDIIGWRNAGNTADLALGVNGSNQLTFAGSAIGSGTTAAALTSASASPALTGVVRLANVDTIKWRDAANGADLALAINGSNRLIFNGNLVTGNAMAAASTAAAQSIPNATNTTVIFGTVERDSDALYNSATGQFTVSAGTFGDYSIWGCIAFGAAITGTVIVSIFKNGVALRTVARVNPGAGDTVLIGAHSYLLNADVITIGVNQNSGIAQALLADATRNFFNIKHGAF